MAYQIDDRVVIRNANLGDLTVQIIDIADEKYPVKYYGAYFVDGVRKIIEFYRHNIIGYANNNNNNSSVATGDPSNLNNNHMNVNSNSSQNGGRSRRRRKNRRRSRRSRRR